MAAPAWLLPSPPDSAARIYVDGPSSHAEIQTVIASVCRDLQADGTVEIRRGANYHSGEVVFAADGSGGIGLGTDQRT